MRKILINAYAVSPDLGSEPGMGWNWCIHLAAFYELHIITEGEFRDRIEAALPGLPQGAHMHFYYLPVSPRIRNMCWNQGDWRFYWHYRKWQKRALSLAREILSRESIDVIHQLNMVGFREPGYLWKIPDIRYIWGPVGGMSQIPPSFIRDFALPVRLKMWLKACLNRIQKNWSPRVWKAVNRAQAVICATQVEQTVLGKRPGPSLVVIPETGLEQLEIRPRIPKEDKRFHLLWVGRFIPTKKLDLALRILSALDAEDIVLDVLGGGSPEEEHSYHQLAGKLGVSERVNWHGVVPHDEVMRQMCRCDLFLFTSVLETTSTVIMEAISAGLPIVCFDACGFGPIVDERIGRKFPCISPEQAVHDFSEAIGDLYRHPQERAALSSHARERLGSLTWSSKMEQVRHLYGE